MAGDHLVQRLNNARRLNHVGQPRLSRAHRADSRYDNSIDFYGRAIPRQRLPILAAMQGGNSYSAAYEQTHDTFDTMHAQESVARTGASVQGERRNSKTLLRILSLECYGVGDVGGLKINAIEILRANLRDRYKDCYAVLKELLQNADDAGATELHIATIERLDGAEHKLLAGPLLIVVNNALFTYRDSCAIHMAGMGSKGLDDAKIGKFGLGLKSVFHLCEAFFYLSDPDGDEEQVPSKLKEYGRTGILNPWLDEGRYSSWNDFSATDRRRLEAIVTSVLTDANKAWFAICLPMRRKSHCIENDGENPARWAIDPKYYGDLPQPPSDIYSPSHFDSICEMLPLMSTLNRVQFWHPSSTKAHPLIPSVTISRRATQHVNWRTMGVGQSAMAGVINVNGNGAPRTWNYVGVQRRLELHDLRVLSERSDWPWMDAQTETGRERNPASVMQHAAVVLLESPGEGALEIERAVFLPLGDPSYPRQHSVGKLDFELLLHGYFFVDAGRLSVDFAAKQEEETARQAWNRILDCHGTLPLVIPALAQFAQSIEGQLDCDEKLRLLTTLLRGSPLWSVNSERICRDGNWVFRLLAEGGRWCQASQHLPLLSLPGDEHSAVDLPFTVFSILQSRAAGLMLTFDGLPRLVTGEQASWPAELVAQMFQSVPVADVTTNDEQLDYLIEVSRELCDRRIEGIHAEVRSLLRRILRESSLAELRKRREKIAALVRVLPSSMTVRVPFKADLVRESERLFEVLIRQSTGVLPVPDILCDPHAVGSRETPTNDVRALLTAISELRPSGAQEDAFHSLVGQSITAILSVWKQGEQSFAEAFGDLPLFYVKNYGDDRRHAFSARELQEYRELRQLFARNANLCKKLQDCLRVDQILFVAEKEMSDLLEETMGPVPYCDIPGCTEFLELRPALSSNIAPRRSLLTAMLPGIVDGGKLEVREVLRYLLHGNPQAASQEVDLFIDGENAWCAAARWALTAGGQSWRMISPDLTDLKPSDAERLRLRKCDASTVPALFKNVAPKALDRQVFADRPDWRNQILREWPDSAKEALKQLPLFDRIDGLLTSITDQTFIQGNVPLPPAAIFPNLVLILDDSRIVESRRLAPTLAIGDVLLTILAREDCRQHWQFILESIPESDSPELRKVLQTAAWIPAPEGRGVAPRYIVSRDGLREHLRQLWGTGRALIHRLDLPEELLKHPRWRFVESLGPRGDELYRLIGDAFQGIQAFAVGRDTVQEDGFVGLMRMFTDPAGYAVMPIVGFLNALLDGKTEVPQAIFKHILPAVRVSLDTVRTRDVLRYLSTRHERSAGQDRKPLLETFNRFLKEGLEQTEFVRQLKQLQFLNQENRWCSPEKLAASGDNISPANLIHRSQLQELIDSGFWSSIEARQPSGEHESAMDGSHLDFKKLAASAKLLGKYLQTWRNDEVPDDALAAVVAMLGNGDGFPEEYEHFRDTRSLDAMRKHFTWDVAGPDGLKNRMDRNHFCILPADTKFVRARNLFGDEFEAAVDKRVTSLFDGFGDRNYLRYFRMPGDGRCFQIWLRQISPDELSREDKLNILGNTVQAIRAGIYREEDEDFSAAWRRITQVGQLDIEIAQEMILEASAMLLEAQLSVRQSERLQAIFAKWHRVRQRAKTAEYAENRTEKEAAEREKAVVLEELRSLLVLDTSTQQLLVSEIRKKLEDNSYSATSIPFELFQNGDDAVVELESLCEDEAMLERVRPAELRRRFIIDVNGLDGRAVLRLVHWGRGINQFRVGTVDGRDQGFDRDMERMLVLQGSGKGESGGISTRTGKFGLGFKSVFFVCDEPRVLSASRSRFRVVAGVYPERLVVEDERRLEEILEDAGDATHKGTVVELSLRESGCVEQTLARFKELAGYQVVFARRIRQCNLCQADRPEIIFEWRPDEIMSGIECGDIRTKSGKAVRSLVFRLGADGYGALLVPISATGVDPEANVDVPKIWCTTPTEHDGPGALVINGLFDLNPGRTQLRNTERNNDLAMQMGQEVGELLCQLHDQSQKDWENLRRSMGCTDASRDGFWSSLWNASLPYAAQNSGSQVLWQVLFGSEHCGIYRLARDAGVIPTGLSGNYEALTSLKRICWRTQGALTAETVWTAAATSDWVKKNIRPGTVISEAVAQHLDRFCRIEARVLSLSTILHAAMEESQFVTPAAAKELGKLISPKRLREISMDRVTASEEEDIRGVLAWTRFQTAAGGWNDAESLLIGHEPATRLEEHRRAAFAPADKLLAEQYRGDGLEFFLACRKEMRASAEQMAQWLLGADDDTKRKAGLEYLERGELSYTLRQRLTEDEDVLDASWLGNRIAREQAMGGMDSDRQAVVLGMLRKAKEIGPAVIAPSLNATRPISEILRDLLAWWRKNQAAILAYHDLTIYPAGRLPQLSFTATNEQLESDVAVRKEWLIVFMLGSMHRIGRATRQQNRGFLDLCEERGWLDVLADRADDPANWFEVMDEYLDSLQGEAMYFNWMNQFLGYYQLSRWLPSYVRAFEAVTRPNVNLADLHSIRDVADLRTSHIFSGSTGFDAPPCSRTMGLGSHFVLREVIRARATQSESKYEVSGQLAKYAFVPSGAVRRLLAQITRMTELLDRTVPKEQVARRIADILYEHLGEAGAFEQNFDVPLLALTWSRFADTRRSILGIDDDQTEEGPLSFLNDNTDTVEYET